jgi:fumarate hydratase class II
VEQVEQPLYGTQTKLAIQNFPISGTPLPREFLRALGIIKGAAAAANRELGLLDSAKAAAIEQASSEVENGLHDAHFPIDVYQTGSGTSTNMNANEVIATLASRRLGFAVHPNDDVNMGQSSNDVIPAAIHISAYLEVTASLLPALTRLAGSIEAKASTVEQVVKNGRTHLMDALPVRMSQELRGWKRQIADSMERVESALPRLARLALGGTAVGTGVNAHPEFGRRVAAVVAMRTGLPFITAPDYFAALSSQDTAVEFSGHLKTAAAALMKISNDLRWMNSGPVSGLSEIRLPALQAGSSIMPGKVNPVIPEAVTMVCARVFGNDVSITVAGQAGNFQLNVMLPLIAHCLLESIRLLSRASGLLAEKAIQGFEVNRDRLDELARRNPMLITVLTPMVGYETAALIVEKAAREGRSIEEIALELTDVDAAELKRLLDPRRATEAGRPG